MPPKDIKANAETNGCISRVGDIPLRRIGTPSDAGQAVLAVVSPLFSYVTGHVSKRRPHGWTEEDKGRGKADSNFTRRLW